MSAVHTILEYPEEEQHYFAHHGRSSTTLPRGGLRVQRFKNSKSTSRIITFYDFSDEAFNKLIRHIQEFVERQG